MKVVKLREAGVPLGFKRGRGARCVDEWARHETEAEVRDCNLCSPSLL